MNFSRRDLLRLPVLLLSYPVVALFFYDKGEDDGKRQEEEYWRERLREREDPSFGDEVIREIEREVTLRPGESETVELNLDRETHISGGMVAGEHIDLMLMEPEDYEEYVDRGDPHYLVFFSELDTTETVIRQTINEGEFYFVVDHTEMGKATPVQPTEIHLELTLRQVT